MINLATKHFSLGLITSIKQKEYINMSKDKIFYPTNSQPSAARSSLQTVTLPELYDTAYMPATALIENFLYSGVYILAGPPKTGKSFLMAQLAYHVAAGLQFFNHKVTPASVLYVCKNAFRGCSA